MLNLQEHKKIIKKWSRLSRQERINQIKCQGSKNEKFQLYFLGFQDKQILKLKEKYSVYKNVAVSKLQSIRQFQERSLNKQAGFLIISEKFKKQAIQVASRSFKIILKSNQPKKHTNFLKNSNVYQKINQFTQLKQIVNIILGYQQNNQKSKEQKKYNLFKYRPRFKNIQQIIKETHSPSRFQQLKEFSPGPGSYDLVRSPIITKGITKQKSSVDGFISKLNSRHQIKTSLKSSKSNFEIKRCKRYRV